MAPTRSRQKERGWEREREETVERGKESKRREGKRREQGPLEDHRGVSIECVHGVHLRHRHYSPQCILVHPSDVEAHSTHQQCTGGEQPAWCV